MFKNSLTYRNNMLEKWDQLNSVYSTNGPYPSLILLFVHKINGSNVHTISWICDKIVMFSGAFACLFLLLRKGQSLFWKSTEQFAQVTKSLRLGIDEGIKISSTHGSSQFIWEMSQSKDIFLELFAHTCLKTNECCVVLKKVKVISSEGNDMVELNVLFYMYLSPSLQIPFICWI